ncbi:MAG: S1 RNA-binding domain-containing protein, partial [Oscillospiraceae bacterium]|nr:S1 RNA-binding domain-containing protein [Oscillospiraceae bacterium]
FKGQVKSITDFGVFVDLGGIDGMVHRTELSWTRIKHPSDVCKVGDVLEVYIKDLDKEKNRISLGYRRAEDNPWEIFKSKYNVDDVVKATVVSVTPFGAFAQIIPGIDGLIHISQIANQRVDKVADLLSVGQEVEAKITEIDAENQRISISMRALLPEEEVVETAETAEEAPAEE